MVRLSRIAFCLAALLTSRVALADTPAPPPPTRHVGEGMWSGWMTTHLVEGGVFGLMPSLVRTTPPSSPSATDAGGTVAFASEIVMRSWYPGEDKSLRFSLDGAAGADSTGFTGAVAHDAMAGFRYAFRTEEHGRLPRRLTTAPGYAEVPEDTRSDLGRVFAASPHAVFARAGHHVHAMGDQAWFSSRIEAPRLEMGWAFDGGMDAYAFEARLEGGFVPVGRFHVGDFERSLGATGTAGVRFVFHAHRFVHVDVNVQRLFDPASSPSTPVDLAATKSCLRILPGGDRSDGFPMKAVCGFARFETTNINGPSGSAARASAATIGILLSLPWIEP